MLLTALVAGAVAWRWRTPAALPAPLVRFAFSLPDDQQFTAPGQTRRFVAISPDGTQLVYAANGRLYRRSIGDLDARVIPGTELPDSPPPYSRRTAVVAFYTAADGTLKRIPVGGGAPSTITQTANPSG